MPRGMHVFIDKIRQFTPKIHATNSLIVNVSKEIITGNEMGTNYHCQGICGPLSWRSRCIHNSSIKITKFVDPVSH